MSALGRWWHELPDARGDLWGVGVTRVLLGPVVVLHLWDFLAPALEGRTYKDRFHVPFFAWLPHPPEAVYAAVLLVGLGAGVAMTFGGRYARCATAVAFAVVLYNLLLDQTAFRHNRAFLAILLGGLALAGPTASVTPAAMGALRPRVRPTGALWPLWLLRALVASVYLASGTSKLLDAAWRSGDVLHDRVVRYQHHIDGLPFDATLVDILTAPVFHTWLAPIAIATELFIGVGLWFRRSRLVAVWVAIAFHAAIEVTASVQVFSIAAIAALAIWTTAAPPQRVVHVPPGSWWERWLPRLDWLARLDVRPAAEWARPTSSTSRRPAEDIRQGSVAALARLPLTFWFAAPVAAVAARRGMTATRQRVARGA